ncbi:hypothetical protein MMPV_003529 [Pyropia vietnamensis]
MDDTMPPPGPPLLPAAAMHPPTRDALLRLAHYVVAASRLASASRATGGSSVSGGVGLTPPHPPPSALEAALGTTRRLVRLASLPTLFALPATARPLLDTAGLDAAAAVSELARAAYLLADAFDLLTGFTTSSPVAGGAGVGAGAGKGWHDSGSPPPPRPTRSARIAAALRVLAAVAAGAVAAREAVATERLWRSRWGVDAPPSGGGGAEDAAVRGWVARKRRYQWGIVAKYVADLVMAVGMVRAPLPGTVGGGGEAAAGVIGSIIRCWQRWPRK